MEDEKFSDAVKLSQNTEDGLPSEGLPASRVIEQRVWLNVSAPTTPSAAI
jgi:hypothetical protein